MQPNQVLEPRKAVSAVRWNPRRDSEVAVAFWHWAEVTHACTVVYAYPLALDPTQPTPNTSSLIPLLHSSFPPSPPLVFYPPFHRVVSCQVYVYDLETWSAAPTRIHRVGHRVKGAAGGNYSLAFVTAPAPGVVAAEGKGGGAGGGGVTTLVAGSAYGVLRGWGLRQPDAVAWEVRTRGNGGACVRWLV